MFAITSHSPRRKQEWRAVRQLGCGGKIKSPVIAENKGQELICKFTSAWLEDLKRFSLYLDQKAIYLKALNESGLLICRTDN